MQTITELVNHYGYIVLFCTLALELIAFPLPGETTMTYCGFLVYEAKMNWFFSILTAASGTIIGITISYFLGFKLGAEFFKKHGSYIHLGPDKLEKASTWFETYGDKLLLLAYFIPGVRHITGYFSGISGISYKKFAFYAYGGAIIWTSTFITLGKFLGANWSEFHIYFNKYILIAILIITIFLIIFYTYKNYWVVIIKSTYKIIHNTLSKFNFISTVKLLISVIVIALLGFFALLIYLIHD